MSVLSSNIRNINVKQNDFSQTVGNNQRVNITGSSVTTVEKEQLTTVKEDRGIHVLKNATTIVNEYNGLKI